MEASAETRRRVEFGLFEVDFREQRLRKRGALVHLQDKPFQVLAMLLERPGDILNRDELQKRLWPGDTYVEFDEGLNTAIKKVRQALGDSADSPTFIETVPRRGYRFIAGVREIEDREAPIPEPEALEPDAPAAAFAVESAQSPEAREPEARLPAAAGTRKLVIVAAVLLLLSAASFVVLRFGRSKIPAAGSVPRIAVLPFENVGAVQDGYFADGIADAVRGKLASLTGIEVIARGSSMPYGKTTKTPTQIARELDVRYLLTATVRWRKGPEALSSVEISPELIEIPDSGPPTVRWQQSLDVPLADVFQTQSGIASGVAQALGLVLAAREERHLGARPTLNLAAYDVFLQAEAVFQQVAVNDTGSLERSLELYERAVALDPDFPEAWARIAETCAVLYRNGFSAHSMRERAEFAANRAAALGPDRPDGYMARSVNEQVLRHDFRRALEICSEGRRLWPTNAALLVQTANLEVSMGRLAEGVEHYREATAFDPRSAADLGEALTGLRRYAEALKAIERAMAISPLNLQLIEDEVNIFVAQGDLAGARAALKKAPQEVEPATLVAFIANQPEDFDVGWVLDSAQRDLLLRLTPREFGGDRGQWGLALAVAAALKGDASGAHMYAGEARKSLEDQLRTQPDNSRILAAQALALAYLGRKEEAIRTGQRAVTVMPVAQGTYERAASLANLVRVYVVVGELEKAVDQIAEVMKLPGLWTPGWLRIDPNFDPLRKNPRFQKLAGTT